ATTRPSKPAERRFASTLPPTFEGSREAPITATLRGAKNGSSEGRITGSDPTFLSISRSLPHVLLSPDCVSRFQPVRGSDPRSCPGAPSPSGTRAPDESLRPTRAWMRVRTRSHEGSCVGSSWSAVPRRSAQRAQVGGERLGLRLAECDLRHVGGWLLGGGIAKPARHICPIVPPPDIS